MTYDAHADCDRQLNEAEDRIIKLNKRIKDLEADIKIKQSVCETIEKEVTEINEKLRERNKEIEELLSEYGRHSEGCPAQYDKKYNCKCGWDRERPKPRT